MNEKRKIAQDELSALHLGFARLWARDLIRTENKANIRRVLTDGEGLAANPGFSDYGRKYAKACVQFLKPN